MKLGLESLKSRRWLTHFSPILHFYTPENLGGIEMEHWTKVG